MGAAVGEYIAFLDSDDTVEPEMYEEMYERAVEENYDIVMCDVNIIYVEENRNVVVSTYSSEEVDLSDYIANGNNITYSVNKLYSRRIWEENQYERMLFEDIALIPSLVTKYRISGMSRSHFTITIGGLTPYPPHSPAIWWISSGHSSISLTGATENIGRKSSTTPRNSSTGT